VVHTLDILPTIEAVAPNCVDTFPPSLPVGLIVEILITGYGVLLTIQPRNTKLFNEMHAPSLPGILESTVAFLVRICCDSDSRVAPIIPHHCS
jgi:hypothetical protein